MGLTASFAMAHKEMESAVRQFCRIPQVDFGLLLKWLVHVSAGAEKWISVSDLLKHSAKEVGQDKYQGHS